MSAWDCSFCGATEGQQCKSKACRAADRYRNGVAQQAIEIFDLKASLESQMETSLMLEGQRDRARQLVGELVDEARRIILNRACTCNDPGHRCGTNQMLDDISAMEAKVRVP